MDRKHAWNRVALCITLGLMTLLAVAGQADPPKTPAPAGVAKLSPIPPLFDFPVRDTCVCVGPDGVYYLIGTTGHPTWWNTNEGMRVWKSKDLKTWEPLGLVWSFEKDSTWQKIKDGKRAIWAPELHYFKGTFWIAYCVNYGGTGVLRSKTGKAEGPYTDIKADGPLTSEIDASLFADDDGKVYFVWQNGKIARMKDDMSGLAEEPRVLKPANAPQVGFEGAFLEKINGRYHLICAEFNKSGEHSTYDCMAASASSIYGPYGDRYLAVPGGGHNMVFKDTKGNWWSTYFGNDDKALFREKPGILPIRLVEAGQIRPGARTQKAAE
jgi:xylan 1,4-beta-xylosidase